MTMMQDTGPRGAGVTAPLTALAHGVGRGLGRAARGAASAYRRLCYGRMLSALGRLDDAQLRTIGIARSEIPDYARRLVRD